MSDYDSPWKEALEEYFQAFILFFFPGIAGQIDWSRGFQWLDRELQQIAPQSETGRRTVDMLAKLWRQNGQEEWVLVHVEVQSQEDPDFAARMYVYPKVVPSDRLVAGAAGGLVGAILGRDCELRGGAKYALHHKCRTNR